MTRIRRWTARSERVAASFRDPSGYVFRRGKGVYRAIDGPCHAILTELAARGVLQELMDAGWLVRTRWVNGSGRRASLAGENPGYEHFLRHRAIEPITYPYEWSISMLADAAVLTLRLQRRLLEAGFALKDATAFNVQFSGGRPVFLDFGSMERPPRSDLWYALGQFHRMFTFPLLLCRLKGWDLRSYFLGSPQGRTVDEVVRALGPLGRWRPACLLDVTLPWLLSPRSPRAVPALEASGTDGPGDPRGQCFNLRRLEGKLRRLADGYRCFHYWARYTSEHGYDREAETAKQDCVRGFLQARRPGCVIDLGCNTGQYSRLAAECGAEVIAVDQSHDAVESLYRQLRERPARITPLVADLASPSPGVGFRNRERPGLLRRLRGDCVLALALVHHLLVDGNLPLAAIRDQLADLTRRDLVVEYVPPDDPMFQRLMAGRRHHLEPLTPEHFREVFCERFDLVGETRLPNSSRRLLLLGKRS